MKKRNAKVFALFMSVAMAMPNVAAAMPVYAAPEVEEAAAEEEEVEEVEEVEFDDVEVEEEAAVEEEDVDAPVEAITAQGNCGDTTTGEDAKHVLWELENGTLRLIADGQYKMASYTKPEEAPWYKYANQIKEVKVSGELKNIGSNAFRGCANLESVEINHSVKTIEESAFEDCGKLSIVTYPSNDKVAVEVYGPYAFKDCVSLEKISFTAELREINEFCFYNCKALKFVNGLNLQGNLQKIETAAFWGCTSLTKLTLPSNVIDVQGGYIGDPVLEAELGITSAQLAERLGLDADEYVYGSADECSNINALEGKLGAFAGCTGLTSVEFKPNNDKGIRHLGDFAFYGCTSIGKVDLPETLVQVDKFAFEDCVGISTVTIANSWVTELYGTFKRCEGITEVTIGTWDDEIGHYLTGVRKVNKEAFQSCTSLTKFIWEGTGVYQNDYIGEAAFRDCKSLQTIELPFGLDEMGDRAFQGCTSLKTINIPDGTRIIGQNAFFEDVLLDDVYLPETLTKIGQSAFSCNNKMLNNMHLMDVYYSGTEAQWEAFVADDTKLEKDNDLLLFSGDNFKYKANKYFDSDIELNVPEITDVKYVNGGVRITWKVDPMLIIDLTSKEVIREVTPDTFHIYQNHDQDLKVDAQWKQQTPMWAEVGNVAGSENEFTYDIDETMKAGDVYSFRIRAEWADYGFDGESKLSPYYTFTIPASEDDFVAVEGLSFVQDNYSVKIDERIDVSAVITPENASDVAYGWKAEDPDIAVVTVSEDKKSVTVTGKKEGHTTVTVSTPEGDKTASFEIYVVNPDDVQVEKIAFDTEKVSVVEGASTKVSINITPADANAKFEWESDNEKYAQVKVANDEKSAIVTGLKEGTTEITVTANNGVTATIPVTITKKAEDDNTVSNIFDKDAAVKGVAVDATHTMTLSVNEEGNFTGAEIKGLDGKVDETMDSYIANIVTKRDKDGNPVEFYSLIFTDGKWDINYDTANDGAYQFKGESYMVAGGVINQSANGLKYCGDKEGWKFLAAGRVVTGNAGLVEYSGEWFWIDDKGSCDDTYEAIVQWSGADFLVHGGRLRTDFTGFTYDPQNQTEWYHITNGQVWGNGEITDISIAGGEMTRMVLDGKVVK